MARRGIGGWFVLATALATLAIAPFAPGAGAASGTGCGPSGLAPRQASAHQMRTSMLCLINRARRRHGEARLTFDPKLRASAAAHSRDMVRHRYFSHSGSAGSTVGHRVGGAGYSWSAVAEVIGDGPALRGSAYSVFQRWMFSAEHRSIILQPRFHDFGVGVWPGTPTGGGPGAATFTVDFGEPG